MEFHAPTRHSRKLLDDEQSIKLHWPYRRNKESDRKPVPVADERVMQHCPSIYLAVGAFRLISLRVIPLDHSQSSSMQ